MSGAHPPQCRDVPGRARSGSHLAAALPQRLTARDREITRLLHEHKVLTSDQIAQLLFGQPSAARRRMLILHQLGIADRFRPWTQTGSAPWHYVLGPAGAAILADSRGTTPAGIGYQRSRTLAIAHNPQLHHLLGVNSFFTVLATTARRSGDRSTLVTWWPETRCATQWHRLARPDAYGRWHEDGHDIDFFLEYDTGTERPSSRVTGKLDSYQRLAEATGIVTPVLFWFPTSSREQGVRHDFPARCPVPVATACGVIAPGPGSPAEAVWLPADGDGTRLRLADLGGLRPGRPGHQDHGDARR